MKKSRRRFWLALAACFAAFGTVFALLNCAAIRLPACLFRKLTGIYCPGCGSTRAVRALLRGDLLDSLRYNPLTAPFLAVVLFLAIRYFVDLWRDDFRYRRGDATFSLFCAVLFIAFFVLRNVPLPAFDFLRPPTTICR